MIRLLLTTTLAATFALMSPDVSGVDRARDVLGSLVETVDDIPIHVAQVGERPYGPVEVAASLGRDVSLIGWDAQAVGHVMAGGPVVGKGSRRLRASMWWRSLADVCDLAEYSLAVGSFDDQVAAVLADD